MPEGGIVGAILTVLNALGITPDKHPCMFAACYLIAALAGILSGITLFMISAVASFWLASRQLRACIYRWKRG